ncbi:MAG: MBL fold metallo-hydrolase [Bacteroidota bacterium]
MQVKSFKVSQGTIKNICYLIYQDRQGVLIDPAWDYDLIDQFLAIHGISISAIVLTHAHYDHTNLAARFSEAKKVPVIMSAIEIETSGFELPNMIKVHHMQSIRSGLLNILPIVTPGHTQGSTCYLIGDHLFCGDTIFPEGVGLCGKDQASELYDSVQLIKNILPPSTFVWSGHSYGEAPGKSLSFFKRNNIYFQLNRQQFISYRNRKNKPDPYAFK